MSWKEANKKVYEYLQGKLKRGEKTTRLSNAPTSTSATVSHAFDAGVKRLIHLPKGAKALSVAPISRYEKGSVKPGEKIDLQKYKEAEGSGEREILIAPHSKFKIIGVHLDEDGTLLIEEELILE